jgi:hypothetical protein
MTEHAKILAEQALALPVHERERLYRLLGDSLGKGEAVVEYERYQDRDNSPEPASSATDHQPFHPDDLAEIKSRREAYLKDETTARDFDDIFRELLTR